MLSRRMFRCVEIFAGEPHVSAERAHRGDFEGIRVERGEYRHREPAPRSRTREALPKIAGRCADERTLIP